MDRVTVDAADVAVSTEEVEENVGLEKERFGKEGVEKEPKREREKEEEEMKEREEESEDAPREGNVTVAEAVSPADSPLHPGEGTRTSVIVEREKRELYPLHDWRRKEAAALPMAYVPVREAAA